MLADQKVSKNLVQKVEADYMREKRLHEIDEMLGKTKAKGLTLVPLSIYISDSGKAKLQLGLARGKQTWDRRREIQERDAKRDQERQLADIRKR